MNIITARDDKISEFLEKLENAGSLTLDGQVDKLTEETDEVYEAVRDLLRKDGPRNPAAVIGELADVIIVCHTIAALLDGGTIQLMTAVDAKLAKNLKRDWKQDGYGAFHHTEGGAA